MAISKSTLNPFEIKIGSQAKIILMKRKSLRSFRSAKSKRRMFLLALVSRCITAGGGDATMEPVTYERMESSTQFIDLMSVQGVVGWSKVATDRETGPTRWAIIDRSSDYARTVFTDDALAGQEGND